MSRTSLNLNDKLYRYLLDSSLREPDLLVRLRRETETLGEAARYQISPEQGQFMALLVELTGALRMIEIGTFTGYSSLCCALAMPPKGRIVCCDANEAWTNIAKRYWREAGVDGKIALHLGLARDILDALLDPARPDGSEAGRFDMAFIDADKRNYDYYYERCLELVRPGGLIMVDNVLWSGGVADPTDQADNTVAIRALNEKLHRDERVTLSLVPIGDGLTLARKRP